MLGGEVGEEDAAITPPRTTLACRTRVFGCCEIALGFAHHLDLSSSQAFELESKPSDLLGQKKPGPVFIGRILRAVAL